MSLNEQLDFAKFPLHSKKVTKNQQARKTKTSSKNEKSQEAGKKRLKLYFCAA